MTTPQPPHVEPGLVGADYAVARLGLPKPTLYDRARREPERFGVERFGRKIMFRRSAIEAIATGQNPEAG